jgi:hypothetical protein
VLANTASTLNVGTLVGQAAGGGVAGAILTAIFRTHQKQDGKRTSAVQLGMSALCQKRTSHLSFDHFVSRNQQIMWDGKSKRLGCF